MAIIINKFFQTLLFICHVWQISLIFQLLTVDVMSQKNKKTTTNNSKNLLEMDLFAAIINLVTIFQSWFALWRMWLLTAHQIPIWVGFCVEAAGRKLKDISLFRLGLEPETRTKSSRRNSLCVGAAATNRELSDRSARSSSVFPQSAQSSGLEVGRPTQPHPRIQQRRKREFKCDRKETSSEELSKVCRGFGKTKAKK